jgi:gliding motility-associated-like protein
LKHYLLAGLALGWVVLSPATGQSVAPDTGVATIGQGAYCGPYAERSLEEKRAYAKEFLRWQQGRSTRQKSSARRHIPIVFHLVDEASVTDQDVEKAVASLNNAFTHSHNDPNGTDFSQGSRGVDTEIEFCLARRAPDGGLTSGIVRWDAGFGRIDGDVDDAEVKTQGQWDPRRYLNVWVVPGGISLELRATYRGSTGWTRTSTAGGYAGGPRGVVSQGAYTDGVVVSSLGAPLLAHEIGHYLSLAHTFAGGCKNDDCTVDGDGICDTPPDRVRSGCGQNSCDTDVLSNNSNGNFPTDVPDMTSNFMDYSSCPTEFTQGQADRMHFTIDSYRTQLAVESPGGNPGCDRPCTADFTASFTVSGRHREPNVPYEFTSTIAGTAAADSYRWSIERLGGTGSNYPIAWGEGQAAEVATTANLRHSFSETGRYRVTLRAWNRSDPDCFASYSRVILITCGGIDARFTPNKRLIASKQPVGKLIDSVRFTNRSVNAAEYEWRVTHRPYDNQRPAQPDFISTDIHLEHTFLEPGDYAITLVARNGPTCTATAGPFILSVEDPTIDAVIRFTEVECYRENSIRAAVQLFNLGYDTIRAGMPVTFFDRDPRSATSSASVLGTYYTKKVVYGKDEPIEFAVVLPSDRLRRSGIWAACNVDSTDALPLRWPASDLNVMSVNARFPPSGQNETEYRNNVAYHEVLPFEARLAMDGAGACEFSDLQLRAGYVNSQSVSKVEWLPAGDLSCSGCLSPLLAGGSDARMQQVVLTSRYACVDTATLSIPKIEVDPPTLVRDEAPSICSGTSGIDGNTYFSGRSLRWYTNPTNGAGQPVSSLLPGDRAGTFSYYVSQLGRGCEGPRARFTYTVKAPPPAPTVEPLPDICTGENAAALSESATGVDLLWYDQATGGSSTAAAPVVDPNRPGTHRYWVTQTVEECESPRVEIGYAINPIPPAPNVTLPRAYCVGDPVIDLPRSTGHTDLVWFTRQTGDEEVVPPPPPIGAEAHNYDYWVGRRVRGCDGPRVPVDVTVHGIDLVAGGPYRVIEGQSIPVEVKLSTAPVDLPYTLWWEDESGREIGRDVSTLVVEPRASTTYRVRANSEYCPAEAEVMVDLVYLIDPTKMFSPNGDGVNETWYVGDIDQYPEATVRIFNRWGGLVYESTGYRNDWTGLGMDKLPLPVATYYFTIDLQQPELEVKTGSVTIIR